VCADDAPTGGFLFALPAQAQDLPDPRRYECPRGIVKEIVTPVQPTESRQCRACNGNGFLAIEATTPHDRAVIYKISNVKHPDMFWDLVENDWRPGAGSSFKSRNQAAKAIERCAIPDAQIRRFA